MQRGRDHAIGGLHFPHAFNPLARIYRESTDPRVRAAALQSIGKIQTVEAGEFLVMVLRQETGGLREAAEAALAELDTPTSSRSCVNSNTMISYTSMVVICHTLVGILLGCKGTVVSGS